MSKRNDTVLVVPFSGGSLSDLAVRTAFISLELSQGGFEVILQECKKLRQRSSPPAAILQIGIGAVPKEGLLCLGELRLLYPDTPRIVISEWNAEDIAKEVNWDPAARFLHWPYGGEEVLLQTMEDVIKNKTAPSQ